MRVDSEFIKAERRRRAWSQQHLATISGLGLRTIQRIEQCGMASYESSQALASCFEIPLAGLQRRDEAQVGQPAYVRLPERGVRRGTAVLGIFISFIAGALLSTMQSVVAQGLFIDVGFAESSGDGTYETQAFMTIGEPLEIALPGARRMVVLPRLLDEAIVQLKVQIFDDAEEPARLLASPVVVTVSGGDTHIEWGTTERVLCLWMRPLLLSGNADAPNRSAAAEAERERQECVLRSIEDPASRVQWNPAGESATETPTN